MAGKGKRALAELAASVNANFDTILSPDQEQAFQVWRQQNVNPLDDGSTYDFRGAFLQGLKGRPLPADAGRIHWPDTFKKPNHPTFSVESRYAPLVPWLAGKWVGEKFYPPESAARSMTSGGRATRNLPLGIGPSDLKK